VTDAPSWFGLGEGRRENWRIKGWYFVKEIGIMNGTSEGMVPPKHDLEPRLGAFGTMKPAEKGSVLIDLWLQRVDLLRDL